MKKFYSLLLLGLLSFQGGWAQTPKGKPGGVKTAHAPTYRLKKVKKAAVAADKARITVENAVEWKDGSGYVLLLDADHDTYGNTIPTSGAFNLSDEETGNDSFDEFETLLPADAAFGDVDHVISFEEIASVDVNAGVYDFAFVNPSPNSETNGVDHWIAVYGYGRANDFKFEGGCEYLFEINIPDDYDNVDLTVSAPYDLGLSDLEVPETGELTDAETISVEVLNMGDEDVAAGAYSVSLLVDGKAVATQTGLPAIEVEESTTVTFEGVDLSAVGYHTITVRLNDLTEDKADKNSLNNSLEAKVLCVRAVDAPVTYTLSTYNDYSTHFVAVDGDEDGLTWEWDDMQQAARIGYDAGSDDYLMTFMPIRFAEGTNHVIIDYRGRLEGYQEKLDVWMGTVNDPYEMTKIGELSFSQREYRTQVFNFEASADEPVFIAFHGVYDDDALGCFIKNIRFGTGAYAGVPDGTVSEIGLPTPATTFGSEQPVSFVLKNAGTDDIKSLTATYRVNEGEEVSEEFTFDTPVAANTTREVVFDKAADFSEVGPYEVAVTLSDVKSSAGRSEEETDNNETTSVTAHMGIEALPFATDLSEAGVPSSWFSEGNLWKYDVERGGVRGNNNVPFVSAGMELKKGVTYRLKAEYMTGLIITEDDYLPASFNIKFGVSGTDVSKWAKIYQTNSDFTNREFTSREWHFTPAEDGVYQIAFDGETPIRLTLRNLTVMQRPDYDVRINQPRTPSLLPLKLAEDAAIHAVVNNQGAKSVDPVVSVYDGSQLLSSTDCADLAANGQQDVSVYLDLKNGHQAGDVYRNLRASVRHHDQSEDENVYVGIQPIELTDSVLAYDRATESMVADYDYSFGNANAAVSVGQIFTLDSHQKLTGINIGWAAFDEDEEDEPVMGKFPVQIYRYDAATHTVGDLMLESQVEKTVSGEFATYQLPARSLNMGDYLAVVRVKGMLLVGDGEENTPVYVLNPSGAVTSEYGFGAPAIRLVFGEGQVCQHDLKLAAINKPIARGTFSDAESIEVLVENNGESEAEATLKVAVDGKELPSQTVQLLPFESGNYIFTADLTVAGEHTITATVEFADDENPADNTLSKTVESVDPADAYELDFESCEDFVEDAFVPSWKGVNADGYATYGSSDYDWTGMYGTQAWLVVNPSMTSPEMTDDVPTHGGDRYGVSACALDTKTDTAPPTDHWLISPKLLMASDNAKLTFFGRSYPSEYGEESYEVLVSVTDDKPESFTKIDEGTLPVDEWQEVSVDLSSVAGKDAYVAIRHTSTDIYMMFVDDITITRPVTGIHDLTADDGIQIWQSDDELNVSSAAEISSVEIFSAAGQLVASHKGGAAAVRISLDAQPSGVYVAQVKTVKGMKTFRFAKK